MKYLRNWRILIIVTILVLSSFYFKFDLHSENNKLNLEEGIGDSIFNKGNDDSSICHSDQSSRFCGPRSSYNYNDDFHNIFNTIFNYSYNGNHLYLQGPIYIEENAAPSFADLDNDADQDLIVGERWGILHYFENTGNSINPVWMKNTILFNNIDIGDYSTPTFKDLDNDNDFDLTIGASDGTLYYYENTGNINTPTWNLNSNMFTGIDVGFHSIPFFEDLDNDNDFDLTIGASDGTLYYYENTGNNQNPIWTLNVSMFSGIFVSGRSAPCFTDLDADNDFDLVIGTYDGDIYYYNNTGDSSTPIWTLNNSMFSGINIDLLSIPTFSDLDNDGDFDLIFCVYVDGILYFYNNTGSSSSPIWTFDDSIFSGIDVYSNNKPALADLDDDADLDLTVGSGDGKLYYYKNIGSASSPIWELNTTMYSGITGGNHYAPTFADLDDDDDFDLTIGVQDGTLKYYNNTGTPQNPIWTSEPSMFASIDIGDFNTPEFSDLDNDGDYDLTMGEKYGTLFYYENIGNSINPIWNLNNSMFPGIDVSEHSKPTFVDLDDDEDYDLVIGNDNGKCLYYSNNGTKKSPNWIYYSDLFSNIDISENCAPIFTDIDNDADQDLLVGSGHGGLLYFFENLRSITSNIELLNGDGFDNKTIYTKYHSYKFQIEVHDNKGYNDIEKIILNLDPTEKNLSYCWSQDTKLFSKLYDPNDYTTLSTGSYENDGNMNWTVVFDIIFDWTYPDEKLNDIKALSCGKKAISDSITIPDFYHVENNLEFVGNLTVIGEYQGNLSMGDWVKGNEKITWGGLKVIYENSSDIYPPDSEFDVTLSDTHDNYWNDTSSSGTNISIISTTYNATNLIEHYKINISGIPSYCDLSNVSFQLKIDADNITFTNPTPFPKIWQTFSTVACRITINDIGGSNVNASSIDYSISNNNGTDWSDWHSTQENIDAQSIECSISADFEDGIDNMIRWRGKDIVGNGYSVSENYNILIDTKNVSFFNPTPSSAEIFADKNVTCSITVMDTTSGVNASTIEYSILKDGETDWTDWSSVGYYFDNISIKCFITQMFNNGTENYIKWRAKDIAGNGYNESEVYQIKIDTSIPLPIVELLYPIDGSTITMTTTELQWRLNYPENNNIRYDVYLDTTEIPTVNVSKGQTEKSFTISSLIDGETYYWTVIPIENGISGRCISGVWSFTVNTSYIPDFGIDLYAEKKIIPIEQGRSYNLNITVKNIGETRDSITLGFDAPLFGNENINLNKTLIELIPEETIIVKMEINVPYDKEISLYDCLINATSLGAFDYDLQVFSNLNLLINVLERSVNYGVNLILEKQKIEIEQGQSNALKLFITNLGDLEDTFEIKIVSTGFDISNIEVAKNVTIEININKSIQMNISIPADQPVKTYEIKITVISQEALNHELNIEDSKILNLIVLKKGSQEITEDSSSLMWIIIIIIISIIIIIIILFIILKKKKPQKEEPEGIEEEQLPEELPIPEVQPEQPPQETATPDNAQPSSPVPQLEEHQQSLPERQPAPQEPSTGSNVAPPQVPEVERPQPISPSETQQSSQLNEVVLPEPRLLPQLSEEELEE